MSTTGTVLNSFASGATALNALAFDPVSNSLFAVGFFGSVRQLTTTGGFINAFTTPGQQWTGAAFDSQSQTLLLMNSTADQVLEYTTAGLLVGTPLSADAIAGNGQGLHYNSLTGVLHVTSQDDFIAVWSRETVAAVPEPASLLLLGTGLAFVARKRTRRHP